MTTGVAAAGAMAATVGSTIGVTVGSMGAAVGAGAATIGIVTITGVGSNGAVTLADTGSAWRVVAGFAMYAIVRNSTAAAPHNGIAYGRRTVRSFDSEAARSGEATVGNGDVPCANVGAGCIEMNLTGVLMTYAGRVVGCGDAAMTRCTNV